MKVPSRISAVVLALVAASAVGCGDEASSNNGNVAGTSGIQGSAATGGMLGAAATSGTGAGGMQATAGAATAGAASAGVDSAGTGVAGAGTAGLSNAGTGAAGVGTAGTAVAGMGSAGVGNTVTCSITASAELSSAIATVGIVTWSTDLPNVDTAYIEFGLADTGPTMQAPVDLNETDFRTLLLGMKQGREYVYRVVASQGADTCTSDEYTLMTGSLGNTPSVTRQVMDQAAASVGFIVTSDHNTNAYIFDTDGDVVWHMQAPSSTSRAHMSYDGKDMWMMEVNVQNSGGEVRRVSMDGLDVEPSVSGLSEGHHDFAVLPDGIVATMVWTSGARDANNALIERARDGTVTTLVPNFTALYNSNGGYHPNAIHYHPSDDTYTISDRNPNLFVKVSRQGDLLWQFGGTNPIGNHFPGSWQVNHGHHVLDNGNFLFFNNGQGSNSSTAREYALDESTWTATEVWQHGASQGSGTLGDVERLPNGNTLITSSNSGLMEEVDPSGSVVQRFSGGRFGYADFRESLYGPPRR